MKTVQQILSTKNAGIFSVPATTSVFEGLQLMTAKNISALLITEGEVLKGIFTERDYARKLVLHGKSSSETEMGEVMTADPITVIPQDSIDHCMEIMTAKHIRHLPVMQDGHLKGMISIGDLVKFIIEDQKHTINQLTSYINQ